MTRHSRRRSISFALVGAILVAIVWSATAMGARVSHRPSPLNGTWTGSYHGSYSGTFTLHWTLKASRLAGRITLSQPHGTYPITGSVQKGSIRFGAVGIGVHYTGTESGSSMSGRWTIPHGSGSWSATKS